MIMFTHLQPDISLRKYNRCVVNRIYLKEESKIKYVFNCSFTYKNAFYSQNYVETVVAALQVFQVNAPFSFAHLQTEFFAHVPK